VGSCRSDPFREQITTKMLKNDRRDKIRLEFIQIDVQGTGKAKRNGDRGDYLGNQSVQIGEAWLGNPELLLADPEDRFVVNLKRSYSTMGRI
jgi:hypothetical protein